MPVPGWIARFPLCPTTDFSSGLLVPVILHPLPLFLLLLLLLILHPFSSSPSSPPPLPLFLTETPFPHPPPFPPLLLLLLHPIPRPQTRCLRHPIQDAVSHAILPIFKCLKRYLSPMTHFHHSIIFQMTDWHQSHALASFQLIIDSEKHQFLRGLAFGWIFNRVVRRQRRPDQFLYGCTFGWVFRLVDLHPTGEKDGRGPLRPDRAIRAWEGELLSVQIYATFQIYWNFHISTLQI